jgi:hypothetical protein
MAICLPFIVKLFVFVKSLYCHGNSGDVKKFPRSVELPRHLSSYEYKPDCFIPVRFWHLIFSNVLVMNIYYGNFKPWVSVGVIEGLQCRRPGFVSHFN